MSFYDLVLEGRLPLLPQWFGSLECWRALDRGKPVTLVRSRPDIIEAHLSHDTYSSNIDAFHADLREIVSGEDELVLREVRCYENGRIPVGIFDPLAGWALRELVTFVRCDVEIAAGLTLAIHRAYDGGGNVLTRDGHIVRCVLPAFANVWESEAPSYDGDSPEYSMRSRIDEGCVVMRDLSGYVPTRTRDADTFYAELEGLAHPDVGPALVRVLREVYFRS